MRASMRSWIGLAVATFTLGLGTVAQAQESKKFDAKKLAESYGLPIFSGKGVSIVSNEVIDTVNDIDKISTSQYSVRADAKKIVEFYRQSLGEPKKDGSAEEGFRYTFKKASTAGSNLRYRVIVREDHESRTVQIMLWKKQYLSSRDADD